MSLRYNHFSREIFWIQKLFQEDANKKTLDSIKIFVMSTHVSICLDYDCYTQCKFHHLSTLISKLLLKRNSYLCQQMFLSALNMMAAYNLNCMQCKLYNYFSQEIFWNSRTLKGSHQWKKTPWIQLGNSQCKHMSLSALIMVATHNLNFIFYLL